jgi:hypothetical protein
MTFEEAKKILEKEGFFLIKVSKGFEFSELPVWEKQEVVEAKRVVNENDFATAMGKNEWYDLQERLKKEHEKSTKAPGPGEEQPEDKKGIIYPTTFPKADFYYKHVLNESNPALKESASQFNDVLLDEQAKKIEELTEENERLKDQVAVIYAYKENNEKYNLKQIKRLGKEIARLNKIIHKKNLKIEELGKESSRHLEGKIKMFGENMDLEQMLKDKDAVLSDVAEELRLSKIREKNLTEVGQKYMKENEELKNELDAFKESYKRRIKEDSEHFEHIQKICNAGLQKWLLESEYLEKDKPFRFSNYDIARGKENKKPRTPTSEEPKHDNSREDFIKKAIDIFNIMAANLGSVGSKDGNGIIDQMIGVDIAKEGADHSGATVLCGKDFVKKFKENGWFDFFEKKYEEIVEELSKVTDETFDQFLQFGEIIIKSEK